MRRDFLEAGFRLEHGHFNAGCVKNKSFVS